MNKINNNLKTFYFSMMLIALTLGATFAPVKTNAQNFGGYVTSLPNDTQNNYQNYYSYPNNYYQYQTPVYVQMPAPDPAPTQTIYSSSENPNKTSATVSKPATAKAKTATTLAKNTSTNNSLATGAIFGSGGFLPSGIIQWILFAILILLIVILVRKVYGADKKYEAKPMKHD